MTVVLGAVMQDRNERRLVTLRHISWEDNRPIWMPKDSVNKLLKVVLSDSVSAYKSGLNLKNIERILNQNAWVEDAQSYVSIDGGIGVQVKTKIPIVRIHSDSNYYLDGSAKPFPLSPNQSIKVPLFYGDLISDQPIKLVKVIKFISKDSFMRDHIVSYEWLKDGLFMEPRSQGYKILLGTTKKIKNKIENYKAFYAKMQDSMVLKKYKIVNLSFNGQVVCSK